MSTVGRILVVVNLALALLVLGAAGALLQRTEATKADYDQAVTDKAAVETELDDLRNESIAKERQLDTEKRRLQEENDDLKVERDNSNRSVSKLEIDNQQLRDDVSKINSKLDEIESSLTATQQQARDLQNRNDDLRDEAQSAKDGQRTAELARRDMEDEIATLRRERSDLDGQITKLQAEKTKLNATVQVAVSAGFDPTSVVAAPPIEATLADVDTEYGFVILDAGSRDQVARGYTFDVYRGGQWLGQVRVDQVFDDYSTAKIVEQNGDMQRFDRATTHL